MEKNIIIVQSIDQEKVILNKEILEKINIYADVLDCLKNENITNYTFIGNNGKYRFHLIKMKEQFIYYKLLVINNSLKNKKNKYTKIEIKNKNINKIVSDIGKQNAQMLHSYDLEIEKMIPLRTFLKQNQHEFRKQKLYYKDLNDNYKEYRYKNLFSKNVDEISDFEKILTLERNEYKILKVDFDLDENIFEYNQEGITIQERKIAREVAKDIYNHKSLYKDKELLESLKSKDLYVTVTDVIPKEHKSIWSKIEINDMNIKVLDKAKNNYFKDNTPLSKKRKYLSKRQKRRKFRRTSYQEIKKGINEYNQTEQ